MFKNFNIASIISIIIIGLFVGVVFVYADWIAPLNSPPTCVAGNPGCDAPINVGLTDQTKNGSFGIVGNISVGGLAIFNNNLAFSEINPTMIYFGEGVKSYFRLNDPDSGPPPPPGSDESILRVVQNNTDRFIVDRNGNVGIGTMMLAGYLTIKSSEGATISWASEYINGIEDFYGSWIRWIDKSKGDTCNGEKNNVYRCVPNEIKWCIDYNDMGSAPDRQREVQCKRQTRIIQQLTNSIESPTAKNW